jgi:predicted PolB exonuclease-like 3'-5' exonuclease
MTLEIERRPSKSEPQVKGGPCEITIDIETIPSQVMAVREYLAKDITPDSRLKDPAKIEADIEKKKEAAFDKAGLHGWSNHIVCLGVKVDDHPAVTFHSESFEDERKIIIQFFDYITENCGAYSHTWIGHNIIGFDLKILRQRCMILGIKWPVMFEHPFNDKWGEAVYDTQIKWTGDKREYISLEKLCIAFGIESPKSDMTGADVYKYWKAGRIKEIADYCKQDVEATYALYRNMTMSF